MRNWILGSMLAAVGAAAAPPAVATLNSSMALSESLAASVGSASDSLVGSSRSSAGRTQSAAGEYRVAAVVDATAARVRLLLEPLDAARDGGYALELPRRTAEQHGVAAGTRVSALARPWGLEYQRSDTHTAFYLVVDDDWSDALAVRPVTM